MLQPGFSGNVFAACDSSRLRSVASLFKQRNKPVDRTQLATALGGDPEHFDLQRVDAVVSRLRRKATAAGMSLPLHAVRGTGYQFQA